MQLRLPTSFYITFSDCGPNIGIGSSDFTEDMDGAADSLLDVEGLTGRNGRVFEITLDVASNNPESVRDVTEDCISIIKRRCEKRGIAAE